jgi:hypothetical protein
VRVCFCVVEVPSGIEFANSIFIFPYLLSISVVLGRLFFERSSVNYQDVTSGSGVLSSLRI